MDIAHDAVAEQLCDTTTMILSRSHVDVNGFLDCEGFYALCIELFGAQEAKQHEQKVRQIFGFFDMDADGTLNERELRRCYRWIRATAKPVNVLLVIDVQNDFIEGALRLQDGAKVLGPINRILKYGRWDKVIYTQDYHPENHISFFENLSQRELHPESKVTKKTVKLYDTVIFKSGVIQTLWPKHCVMNTWGAELHKDLLIVPSSEQIYKARDPDEEMYSAFGNTVNSELDKILSDMGATHIYVCGLATDICVKETSLEGLSKGYQLAVLKDCCCGLNPDDTLIAEELIHENGGLVTDSDHALSLVNEDKRSLVMAYHAAKKMT